MNSLGNEVFAGMIKMRSHWIRVGLDPAIVGRIRAETCGQRYAEGRRPRDSRTETVMSPPDQGPRTVATPEAGRDKEGSPLALLQGVHPCAPLDFGFPVSRTMREQASVV